jgi:hypothetical protein
LRELPSLHAAYPQAHLSGGPRVKKVLPPHQLETDNTMKNKELN